MSDGIDRRFDRRPVRRPQTNDATTEEPPFENLAMHCWRAVENHARARLQFLAGVDKGLPPFRA